MTDPPDNNEQIAASLRKILNTHGHGFHYAVVRRAEELRAQRESSWIFEGTEIPVLVREETTHVDLVLRTRSNFTYLVGECKRADPAKARWCFARSPYTWRNATNEELIFDQLILRPNQTHGARPRSRYVNRGSYQLGLELRTGQQGDGQGGGGREIANAISQVLRSTSGFINLAWGHTSYPKDFEKAITFIPAIFTTAQLWTTEADLGGADLATGNLTPEQVEVKRANWPWFTYNRSAHLSHWLPYEEVKDDVSRLLRNEYARTIAIVGVEGIDEFLRIDMEEWIS